MPTENKTLQDVLTSNLCFKEMFNCSYKEFLDKRTKILLTKAEALMQL